MSPLYVGVLSMLLTSASAQVFRFSSIYGDGMVLQMTPKQAQFSGFGQPGARITLSMDAGAVSVTGFVNGSAKWEIHLPPQPAGGPHNITVEQFDTSTFGARAIVSLRNVTFGDVWVCAGEGNMELPMRDIFNATQEMETALNFTRLRLLHVAHYASDVELAEPPELTLPWSPVTRAVVGNFPALCLLYGERLSAALGDRDIGLVAATWQDTPVEAWASSRVTNLCNTPPTSGTHKTANNALWNGMIYPLTKMAVRGAIWSQGESNVAYNTDLYTCHFRELTKDWRDFGFFDGNVNVTVDGWAFPFGFVQLGAMDGADAVNVSLMRSHQVFDTQVAPNHANNETYMAAAYDLFDQTSPLGSVYYRDKQTVATRLANAARRLIYNETNLHFIGPIASMMWDYETSIMNVTYSWDIRIRNKAGEPSGFSYKDPSGEWIDAPLIGVFEDTLSFYVHPNYTHVAYAWSARPCDYLQCNVYSASPHNLPHITTFFPPWEPPQEPTTTTIVVPEDTVPGLL